MASVHPSRMGLVPQNGSTRDARERRGRSPSPRHRHERDRSRSRDREGRQNAYERHRDGGREGAKAGYERRPSPKYEDYRHAPPHIAQQSPRSNMYGGRGGGGGRGNMNNADWFESRRAEREARTIDVWPPSPKEPDRSLSPRRKKSSRKHKRGRSPSSDDSSSEEERKKRKEKKRARKERHREEKEGTKNRHRSRSRTPRSRSPTRDRRRPRKDDVSDDREERRRRDRSRSKSLHVKSITRSPSRQPPRSPSPTSEKQRELSTPSSPSRQVSVVPANDKGKTKEDIAEDDDDDEVGPHPIMQINNSKRLNERDYGGALLRGEGSAMAAFLLEDPSVRIPRRGEIGLTSDQIARYETVGYVMSGSRHKRMNAVRMRKENQVISAEEKRGILKLQKEERERREAILREEFSEIVNEKLKAANVNADMSSAAPPPSP